MNINQLRYFISVAEEGSFTKAGKKNFISQTAITLQVRQLEEYLGCELINRNSRPISLTVAGKTFLKEAKSIVSKMDNATLMVKEAANGLEGNLKLGYLKGYERSDLSEKLAKFHNKYPNILISAYRMASDELSSNLLSGNLDTIITWDSTNLKNNNEIEGKLIESVPLVVALYANHPLANRKFLVRSDLNNENIIYMTPSSTIDSYGDARFMELYQMAGYKPKIIFSSCDFESVLIIVSSEQGISIMPEYCTKKLDNANNLVFIPLIGNEENEEITFFYKKDNENIKIIDILKDIL